MARFDRHLGIEIIAGGTTGNELMELHVDGQIVNTWFVQGTDADAGVLYPYFTDLDGIDPSRVSIHFVNDLYDPANNVDRNLRVDAVIIDGVRYETEDSSVFSTGTWRPEDGVTAGNGRGEYLHADGFFQFAGGNNSGSTINIYASGDTGSEQAQLLIDGQVVRTFDNISNGGQVLSYQHSSFVSSNQVRVAFTNDFFLQRFRPQPKR